ncbi:hypothetical protein MED121_22617 [Marinomonas sp. MED121]|nr:hypothetical protein MED121_22617 [Marinomonas sp. MED121]
MKNNAVGGLKCNEPKPILFGFRLSAFGFRLSAFGLVSFFIFHFGK